MGEYGYYRVQDCNTVRAVIDTFRSLTASFAAPETKPQIDVRTCTPAQLKKLHKALPNVFEDVLLLGSKSVPLSVSAAAHFQQLAPFFAPSNTEERSIIYETVWTPSAQDPTAVRKKHKRESFTLELGFEHPNTATIEFLRSIDAPDDGAGLSREAHKRAAEEHLQRIAQLFGIALHAEVTLAPGNEWPREKFVKVSTTTPNATVAPQLQGASCKLQRSDKDLRALFVAALEQHTPPLQSVRATAKGNLTRALEYFAATETKFDSVMFEKRNTLEEKDLEKLASFKTFPGNVSIEQAIAVPTKNNTLELALQAKLSEYHAGLEFSCKWGLSSEELKALKKTTKLPIHFTMRG